MYIARSYEYQQMIGFGGAFTDSTGLNIAALSQERQDQVIRYIETYKIKYKIFIYFLLWSSYFANNGLRYSLGRIPIAGSDFSTRPYSYDDTEDDVTLENWSLQYEDYNYKVCSLNIN